MRGGGSVLVGACWLLPFTPPPPRIYGVMSDGSRALFGLVCEVKAGVAPGWQIEFVLWAHSTGVVEAPQSPVLKRLQNQSDRLVTSAVVARMDVGG